MTLFRALVVALAFSTCCNPQILNKTNILDPKAVASKDPGLLKDSSYFYVPKISFVGPVDAASVQQTMTLMAAVTENGAKAIVIEWNTPGGEVDSGFLLAKAIEDSPIPVVCVVDGEADSMGAYILQSCHVRIMTKRAVLMIHEPAMGGNVYGHEVKWRSIADQLKAMTMAMVEHIAARTKVKPAEMLAKIQGGGQWWLAWQEALDLGVVDAVVADVKTVTEAYRTKLGL